MFEIIKNDNSAKGCYLPLYMWLNLSSPMIGPLCSLLSSFTWAIGTTTYSSLASRYSSQAINLWRASVALPLLCLALYFVNGEFTVISDLAALSPKSWLWFTISIFGSFALGDTLFLLSTRSLGVPAALAIASTYPIWSALAGWIFLGNPFRPAMAIGVALIVAGTIWVILSGKRAAHLAGHAQHSSYWVGVALAFATSLCWSLNAFGIAVAGVGVSPIVGNIARTLMAVIFCPLVGVLLFRKSFRLIPARHLGIKVWIFALEACLGSLLFLYGITHAPLATAAALSSLAPVIAVCLAWGQRKGAISFASSAAVFIVVIGIWILVGA